jgi:type VI secretion system secreted protein VgrG
MPATDEHRPFTLTTPLGADVLLLARLSGSERLGQPFHYQLDLLSERGDLDADQILGKAVALSCPLPAGGERHFHGLVSDFTQLSYGERFHEYQLTLRPWFWFLSRTADCRVFQDLSVPEIFEKLVKEKGFSDFRLVLKGSYKKLAYCVQYRETAFNFLSRLLEQEGIYYYFEHAGSKHTMVLVDDSSSHAAVANYGEVPYYPPTLVPSRRVRDHLTAWTCVKAVQPGKYVTLDYDFKTPEQGVKAEVENVRPHGLGGGEVFDYPAELPAQKDTASTALMASEAARVARVRLQELQLPYSVARGQGNAMGLASGALFKLQDYPRQDYNIRYLIVGTEISVDTNAHETGEGGDVDWHVGVEAIDHRTQYRPPRVAPKPVVQGAQTATVVGKAGEEIDTDELGRIKVQFHWDRRGRKDEQSSCRVRVAQVWAGKQWGAIHIPRIGQEVIVSFLEGDPDRPIVTGRVYNGSHAPPYKLPDNATQSGIKSRSSKGGDPKRFNEIRFEDKAGSEEFVVHAEKDLKVDVENDGTWRVGLNEDSPARSQKGVARFEIGKTLTMDVGDEITLVTGQSKIVMKKDGSITVECKSLAVKATQLIDLDSKQDIKAQSVAKLEAKSLQVAVEGTTKVEIKSSVSTKVEGTMLDLSAAGIASLKGSLTKIG